MNNFDLVGSEAHQTPKIGDVIHMIEVAESISSFPHVPPVNQPDQLQVILDRLAALEERVASQDEEIARLEAVVTAQAQEITTLKENWREAKPATTASRVDDLWAWVEEIDSRTTSQPSPQPMQKDRGDILRALLATNDGKMLAKDARRKMHLSKSRFSELLATMGEYIETKPFSRDHRQKVLVLK